jgi:hypothetical protein
MVYDKIMIMSDNLSELRVSPGTCVEINLLSRDGGREHLMFDLVPDEKANFQSGFLGASTPLAKAIMGEKAGVTVPYFIDELMGIEIVSVQESIRVPNENAARQRDTSIQNAKDQIEFTNALLFAASVNTKWGSYDADGLDYKTWKAQQSDTAEEEVETRTRKKE